MQENRVKCLNPWDPQSKRQYCADGIWPCLDAGEGGGGQAHGVLYPVIAIEGNGARASHKGPVWSDNGKMYTLNTIEQHAVCYAIEGNTVDRVSSKNGRGWCKDVSPTLNTQDRHAVCYTVDGRNNCLNPDISGTLQAHNNGGWSINCTNPVMYKKDEVLAD